MYLTRSAASKNSLPLLTLPNSPSFSAATSVPKSLPSVSCQPSGPWSQSAQVRYLIAACGALEAGAGEGWAALREKPMFSKERGEGTDQ